MSPWGRRTSPSLGAFVERPDLERHLAAIEAESRAEGLVLRTSATARAKSGTIYEVRAYEGKDGLGRPTMAVRVASPFGVVLALGPLGEADSRERATAFVPSIPLEGSSLKLPADLNGDGHPEIALRSDRGHVAIFALAPRGASEIGIELPTQALELRAVGGPGFALWTRRTAAPGASLAPRYERIATFDAGKFTERTPRVRAWHQARAQELEVIPEGATGRERLERALDRAFHEGMASEDDKAREAPLDALEAETVAPDLRDARTQALDDLARELGVKRADDRKKDR